jgi:hypothetical protein
MDAFEIAAFTVVAAALCFAVTDVPGPANDVPMKPRFDVIVMFGLGGLTAAPQTGARLIVKTNGVSQSSGPLAELGLIVQPVAGFIEIATLADSEAVESMLLALKVHVVVPWAPVETEIGLGVQLTWN